MTTFDEWWDARPSPKGYNRGQKAAVYTWAKEAWDTATAAERERCAALAERFGPLPTNPVSIAAAIRSATPDPAAGPAAGGRRP